LTWLNNVWLVVLTILKNMKVSWDDEIPNIWKNKIHVPNHQPGMLNFYKPGRNSVVLLGCDSQLS
jgi:hypothetical protein